MVLPVPGSPFTNKGRCSVTLAKLLQSSGGEMKMCCANASVKDTLETSGFNSLIKVYATEKEAHAAFTA